MNIQYHEIKNEKLRVVTSNLGAHLMSVFVNEDGVEKDVVLGYEHAEDCFNDKGYIGGVVGRIANRIKDGQFELNGKIYQVSKNDGNNHIHGGFESFDRKIFDVISNSEDAVTYQYISPDQEEGYPGELTLNVTYSVEDSALKVSFYSTTDQDTIQNPTCHVYFNLSDGDLILDHELKVDADSIVCVDREGIPTGEIRPVDGTVFDFRNGQRLGDHVFDDIPEITERKGYDHAFVLNEKDGERVVLKDPKSGRFVKITTSLPVVQVYTGNYLGGIKGKNGIIYKDFGGVAIETQYMTDSTRMEEEPKVILRKGEEYRSYSIYSFGRE